ncbi:uncharacterized protein LOC120016848 [Tripterygium wilfordii]|nr:uncharacterized protein LOC120016848 [Tripterygium wilfordii]
MGLEKGLDFEQIRTLDLRPNSILPYRSCSKTEGGNTNKKLPRKDDRLRIKEGFTEIKFRRCQSSSCRSIPSRSVGLEGGIESKRGSVYQSSKEVREMKNIGTIRESEKVQLSRSSDYLYSLDEEHNAKRSSVRLVNSNLNSTSVSEAQRESCSSDTFIEIDPTLDKREKVCDETAERDLIEDLRFRCEQIVGPLDDGNELLEQNSSITLHKSLSVKLEIPQSPSSSKSECSSRESSKTEFSPIRKMFDPFMKSKSLRSPLGYLMEPVDAKTLRMEKVRRNRAFRKSLIRDFSYTAKNSQVEAPLVRDDHHFSMLAHSPVHLHGCLKLMSKHGVPFFEFSLNCPEEVLVAKTWKADCASSWVYTFHSVCSRKRSNVGGRGSSDSNKELSVVGQMQVSCYLCSELKDGGDFNDSMVTEFVLYDIEHARQSQERSECSSEDAVKPPAHPCLLVSHELDDRSRAAKVKHQVNASDGCEFYSSNPYPFAPAILHPNLETAAIVIQVPFEKRESLKYRRGDMISDKVHSNLLNLSRGDQRRTYLSESKASEMVKVVIPSGNHGSPSVESQGPSSLLDRWRLGGGCDCGGWDMACPIVILGNPGIQHANDQPLLDKQRPVELSVQGSKDRTPALFMTVVEEGEYAITFHAKLSTLQAFSICVALLHGTETSVAPWLDKGNNLPHCNILKVLTEEEVKFLVEAVAEEKEKKVSKRVQEIPQSYVLNPPFSPIARV